jgi:uncharacterized membrane protein YcfT
METIYWAWAISAGGCLLIAVVLGFAVPIARGPLGVLIDRRGRYSLTHFQLVVWTIVILSLVSGIFWARLIDGVGDPLSFEIPDEVLGLLGIVVGSAVATGIAKSAKDLSAGDRVAASGSADPPRPAQIFLLEEGAYADRVVDVTKFQNFIITLVLVVAYVAMAIEAIRDATSVDAVTVPTFSGTFLTLLGISHAAYVAGKVPEQAGTPPGLTVKSRETGLPPGGEPRNPKARRQAGLEPYA